MHNQITLFKPAAVGERLELRDYQGLAIEAIFDYFVEHDGSPIVVLPVGGGKSLTIAEFMREANIYFPPTRCVVLAHVAELLTQNAEELMKQWPDADISFYSDTLGQKMLTGDIIFAGIQSVYKKAYDFRQAPDLIIVDECFTGDTIISTSKGEKCLDKVRLGDIVYNAIGKGMVTAISKKITHIIYKVRLSNGTEIRCTGNHPFLSYKGWIEARNLAIGTALTGVQNMPELWHGVSPKNYEKLYTKSGPIQKSPFLLNLLLKEARECDVDTGSKREDAKYTKKDRSQAIASWWKQQRNDKVSRNDTGDDGEDMDWRTFNRNERWPSKRDIPELLQGGRRKSASQKGNRGGWSKSLWEETGVGQKKGKLPDVVRVENITIEESRSGEAVYNLQVNGHPSYFAGGVLVHNCHLIPPDSDTMYRKFLDDMKVINPHVKVVGFTGTPFRAGYGMLHKGKNALFTHIVYEITIPELISRGHLVPIVTPEGGIRTKMDTRDVKSNKGDYIQSQLAKAVDDAAITKACVDEIVYHGETRRRWLIFTVDIQHCQHVRDEIRARGIECEMIHSKTPTMERNRIVDRYKNGDLRCLVNVAVFTTGFNNPSIDLLAFMRPTRSPVLYIQMAGRGMRTFSGKSDCLLLDFGGVVEELGPIDAVHIKEPTEGTGVAPVKYCPGTVPPKGYTCGATLPASLMKCPECGYEFPEPGLNLDTTPSDAPALSAQLKAKVLRVNRVMYYRHKKEGKPDTLRVDYLCGAAVYRDWQHFEHSNRAREESCAWWRAHAESTPPNTITEALQRTKELRVPLYIHVKKIGKYHEVLSVDFNEPEAIDEA